MAHETQFDYKMNEEFSANAAVNNSNLSETEQLKKLMAENLKYNRAIFADTQKIRRYMFWRLVMNIIWLIIILTPIILALIYLPPVLREAYQSYQEVVTGGQGALDLLNQLNKMR